MDMVYMDILNIISTLRHCGLHCYHNMASTYQFVLHRSFSFLTTIMQIVAQHSQIKLKNESEHEF